MRGSRARVELVKLTTKEERLKAELTKVIDRYADTLSEQTGTPIPSQSRQSTPLSRRH